MVTTTNIIDASAGTAAITVGVDAVSPGSNRRVVIHSQGSRLIIVGYDIA
jgi:hypothetical protein